MPRLLPRLLALPSRPSSRRVVPLLLVALAGTGCSGDSAGRSSAGDAGAALAVRAAAGASTAAGSSQFELTSSTDLGGQPLRVVGRGAFDYATKEGLLTLTLPSGTAEQRVVDGTVYLALSQQPGVFYALDLDEVTGTSLDGSTDPSASFAALEAVSGDVTEVGRETVRDTPTTHYRGTLDVEKALAATGGAARQLAEATLGRSGLDEVPFDVWLDDEGRLRRYVQELEVPASEATGGRPVTTSTTIELYDFGTEVDVDAPPAASVQDGAPLLAALRGGPGGGTPSGG